MWRGTQRRSLGGKVAGYGEGLNVARQAERFARCGEEFDVARQAGINARYGEQ